jgi:hypothetical protein
VIQTAIRFSRFGTPWAVEPIESPAARELADRHPTRQTPGARGFIPPGFRMLWRCADAGGAAIWSACRNVFREVWRWRNTIFRNETSMLSSDLVRSATIATYIDWLERYRSLPSEQLITEIDVEATAPRRSKRSLPGHCYLMAGWTFLYEVPASHGRPLRHVLGAPSPEIVLAEAG